MTSTTDPHLVDFAHLMVEHSPISTALYDSQDFRLLAANAAFLQPLADYVPDLHRFHNGLIGLPLIAWFPKAHLGEMLTIFQSVAESGIPYRKIEYPTYLPGGQTHYWNWSLHPILDEHGATRYLLQTSVNVTSELNVRFTAQNSQQRNYLDTLSNVPSDLLRSILDQFSEGILIAEIGSGSTSYANEAAARYLGISLPALMNTPIHRHIWPKSEVHVTDAIPTDQSQKSRVPWLFSVVHALCGETIKEQESLIGRPDGGVNVVLISSIPLRTESSIILGAVVIFHGSARQKSIEQHRQEFVYAASHELRTPITAIQGLAELLQLNISKGQLLDSSRIERILGRLTEQSEQLSHLVGELLDVSLIEQEQFTLNRVRCDLLPLVVRGVEFFTTVSISHKHSIHLSLEGPVATETLIGHFDKEYIVQVLRKIISNAIKYSPAGGHIEVTLRHTPDKPHEVTLSIQDEGIGISPHDLPHIFERFHRAETLDSSISGLGIGLYLAREIVTRHGGRVWAENNAGKGSTFHVVLPLEDKRE